MKGEEIGDGEADQQGQHPGDDGELDGLRVGPPGDRREQQLLVVLDQEVGDDLGGVVVEEAHHDDGEDRHDQEQQEDQRQRRHLQIGYPGGNAFHLGTSPPLRGVRAGEVSASDADGGVMTHD